MGRGFVVLDDVLLRFLGLALLHNVPDNKRSRALCTVVAVDVCGETVSAAVQPYLRR